MLSSEVMTEPATASQSSASISSWRAASKLSWIGQMIASLCWIVSVFAYGVTSVGDGMQLVAASAWFIANVAALYESPT